MFLTAIVGKSFAGETEVVLKSVVQLIPKLLSSRITERAIKFVRNVDL